MRSPDTGRPPRLADVAAASGVAISTVSRALANPGRVNAVTRERIERVARELGYVPNAHGRALSSGKTGAVAVVLSDVTNPFYFDIIRGTQQALKEAGYLQVLVDTDESDQREDHVLRSLSLHFDGAILAASRLTDRDLIRLAGELPIVAINRQTRGVADVFVDTPSGITLAVEHLVELGHRTIAYVAGPDSSWSNLGRWRAFLRAAERAGVRAHRIATTSPRRDAGIAAADVLLGTGATAAVAFNDLIAIGMLRRLAERGVRVPEDLSIVGCDDIFGADFCSPPLTTIGAPIEQAGRLAVTTLLDQLADRDIPRTTQLLPTRLVVRGSSGPAPAAADPVDAADATDPVDASAAPTNEAEASPATATASAIPAIPATLTEPIVPAEPADKDLTP